MAPFRVPLGSYMTEAVKSVSLCDVSTVITSGSRGWARYYARDGSPFIRMTNLRRDGIDLNLEDLRHVSLPKNSVEAKRTKLRKDDILVSITAELGKIGFVRSVFDSNAFISQHVCLIRIESPEIDNEYVAYLLSSEPERRRLNRLNDAGAKAGLNLQTIARYRLTFPPLPEQRKIAEILRAWDEAIEKLEALRAAKAQLLNYQYATIFHPGSTANSGWPEHRIGDFVNSRVEKALPSTEMPLYSLTIEDGITPKTERYNREFLVKDRDAKTYKIVHPDDIVFNPANLRWGAIARSQVNHPIVVSPIYEVLGINSNKIDPDYLNHALTCPYQIRRFATKVEGTLVERMAVKLDTFLMTKILVPNDREEQARFSRIFNTMETEIRTLSRQKALIERQKRGLMQKLLTGEWRVKV